MPPSASEIVLASGQLSTDSIRAASRRSGLQAPAAEPVVIGRTYRLPGLAARRYATIDPQRDSALAVSSHRAPSRWQRGLGPQISLVDRVSFIHEAGLRRPGRDATGSLARSSSIKSSVVPSPTRLHATLPIKTIRLAPSPRNTALLPGCDSLTPLPPSGARWGGVGWPEDVR